MIQSPVLITTALAPADGMPQLKMTDSARRTVATRAAVLFWAAQRASRIVVADATGRACLSDDDLALLREAGCTVEQVAYQQDDGLVRERGKGFAEGRLIAFALDNSELLREASGFFKCTGKIICRNFESISRLIEHERLRAAFWMGSYGGTDLRLVDLRFYFADRALFRETLQPAYESSHASTLMVEGSVTSALAPVLSQTRMLHPRLSGFSGGLDQQYPEIALGDLEYGFPGLTLRA